MNIAPPLTRGSSGPSARRLRFQRWWLIPIALLVAAGLGLWWYQGRSTTAATTTTAAVTQGPIAVTVSGSGSVAAARTVDLAFEQDGTITSVDVAIGDTVAAGQTLATIDASDLQLALQQAQASLKAAEAQLTAAQEGSATPQDLASAQASLDSAQAQLAQTTTGTASKADIASAQAQLTAAKAQLEALTNPTATDLAAAQRKVEQAQIALQSTRDSASQAKTNAQIQLNNATNALTQAQSKYSTAYQNWQHVQDENTDPTNPTTTNSSGVSKPNTLNDAQRQQYYDAYVQADAALKSAENAVTQAQVSYDAARQSEVLQIQQAEATLQDAQDQLAALQNPSATDLAQARASVTQAQASLAKLTEGGTASEIAQAQASVTQAQSNLDKLTAPASDAELAAAEASLLQAQANVATAQHNLDQASLQAPFAGVVSAVSLVPGARASSSASTAAITLVDQSSMHIDVSLSETDAAKVQVGQPVSITFDALSDVTLAGTVATIAPAATATNNVVTYAVTVTFDPGDTPVKVGMSATADIQLESVDDAILVPTRAITTSGAAKTVTVVQGASQIAVTVTTGLVSDGKTAITSSTPALKAGDQVLVPSTASSTSTTTSSQAGGPSGGMPFGP
jgi:HlyD family secretion protein